jgi:hypothetical protein
LERDGKTELLGRLATANLTFDSGQAYVVYDGRELRACRDATAAIARVVLRRAGGGAGAGGGRGDGGGSGAGLYTPRSLGQGTSLNCSVVRIPHCGWYWVAWRWQQC